MSANLYIILPFYFFLAWGIDQKYKIQIVPQKNRKKIQKYLKIREEEHNIRVQEINDRRISMTTAQVCICFYFSDEQRTSSSNQKVFLCIQQSPVSQVIPYKRVAVADGKTGMPMYQPGVNPLMFQQHMAMPFQQGGFFPGTVACKFLFQVIFKRDISYQASSF